MNHEFFRKFRRSKIPILHFISNMKKTLQILVCTMLSVLSWSQTENNPSFYLIDSTLYTTLSAKERIIADSILHQFHKQERDTLKLHLLDVLTDEIKSSKPRFAYINIIIDSSRVYLARTSKKNNELACKKYLGTALYNSTNYLIPRGKFIDVIKNAEEAILYFKEIEDGEGEAKSLANIAYAYQRLGEFEKALNYNFKSAAMKETLGSKRSLSSSYNNIGFVYKGMGDIENALKYYFKSLEIREEIGYKKGIAVCLNNIGDLYFQQGEYDLALNSMNRALDIRREINDVRGEAISLNNIGYVYVKQGKLEEGEENYKAAIKILTELEEKDAMVTMVKNIGKLQEEQGKFIEAEQNFLKSLAISSSTQAKPDISNAMISLSRFYFRQNQLNKAKSYAQQSLKMAKEAQDPYAIRSANETLHRLAKKNGNFAAALNYYEEYITLRDSLNNNETEKTMLKQKAEFEQQQQEKEIVLLKKDKELLAKENTIKEVQLNRNKTLTILSLVLLALSLVLIFFVLKSNRRKRIINGLLREQNEVKSNIIKEIHHRVKNNLQVVNSLLRRQAKDIEDEKVVELFKTAQSRVVSMAILHEKMYNTDQLNQVDAKEHIEQLVDDIVKAYKINIDIDTIYDMAPLPLKMQTLVPLGLIINELITNSLKYAFSGTDKGAIYVSLKKEDDKTELIIGDDGVGIEEHENLASDRMGTRIVQTFVRQLEGTIELLDRPGTFFKLTFVA